MLKWGWEYEPEVAGGGPSATFAFPFDMRRCIAIRWRIPAAGEERMDGLLVGRSHPAEFPRSQAIVSLKGELISGRSR